MHAVDQSGRLVVERREGCAGLGDAPDPSLGHQQPAADLAGQRVRAGQAPAGGRRRWGPRLTPGPCGGWLAWCGRGCRWWPPAGTMDSQLGEQCPQRGLVVRQRPVGQPPPAPVDATAWCVSRATSAPQKTSILPPTSRRGLWDLDNWTPRRSRAGQPRTTRRQPRYEQACELRPGPYQRSRTPCGPGDTTSAITKTGAMSHARTAGLHPSTKGPQKVTVGCTTDLGQVLSTERMRPCPSSAGGSARSSRLRRCRW
jgi:hypothetical protein